MNKTLEKALYHCNWRTVRSVINTRSTILVDPIFSTILSGLSHTNIKRTKTTVYQPRKGNSLKIELGFFWFFWFDNNVLENKDTQKSCFSQSHLGKPQYKKKRKNSDNVTRGGPPHYGPIQGGRSFKFILDVRRLQNC